MISDERTFGDHVVVTISDEGLSHRCSDIPNQDSVSYDISGDDYVMAVSDGVGSCPKSDVGSKIAVEVTKTIFRRLEDGSLSCDLRNIVQTLIKEWMASLPEGNVDEYCATIKGVYKIGNSLFLFSLGDGLLIVTSNGLCVCSPESNKSFSNQTLCLNSRVCEKDFWISKFDLDTYVPYVVFLCTDGIANSIKEGQEINLVRELEENTDGKDLKDELEDFVMDISNYSMDDRTVGVVKYERKNAKSIR